MEVMVGTVSTLTAGWGGQKSQCDRPGSSGGHLTTCCRLLTFDLGMLPVLLRLAALGYDGGRLGDDGRWDLLQDVDRLDGGLRGAGAHRGRHGVGYRLDALR